MVDLSVSEIFHSIQGEGPETGQPTIFVRLAGCNLRHECPLDCDTKYAWEETEPISIFEVADRIHQLEKGAKHVTITGGEPLLQDSQLSPLLTLLKDEGYRLSLETNGTISPPLVSLTFFDTIVVSPKFGHINTEFLKYISRNKLIKNKIYLKFVVKDLNEIRQALSFRYMARNPIYIQPHNGDLNLLGRLIDKMQDFKKVRFSFQIHKQIWGNVPGR